MNKLFLAFAVASMTLLAAPPADAKKDCPKEGCAKTEKACDKKACDVKADKKGCCPEGADKKACDAKQDCKPAKKA